MLFYRTLGSPATPRSYGQSLHDRSGSNAGQTGLGGSGETERGIRKEGGQRLMLDRGQFTVRESEFTYAHRGAFLLLNVIPTVVDGFNCVPRGCNAVGFTGIYPA